MKNSGITLRTFSLIVGFILTFGGMLWNISAVATESKIRNENQDARIEALIKHGEKNSDTQREIQKTQARIQVQQERLIKDVDRLIQKVDK